MSHAEGNPAKTLAIAEQAMATQPQDTTLLNLVAICHMQLGRPEQAIACWQQAIGIRPDYADAHNNIGIQLKRLRRHSEAELAYRQALQVNPVHADAHFNLGMLLQELGNFEKSTESYQQALRIRPDHAAARNGLGNLLKELKRFDDAEVAYRQALHSQPEYADAHCNLGMLLQHQGSNIEADQHFSIALGINPDHVIARWCLAFSKLAPFYSTLHEQEKSRNQFYQELISLQSWLIDRQWRYGPDVVGSVQPFYLAYHGEDNRDILKKYGEICVNLMERWYHSVYLPTTCLVDSPPIAQEQERIGSQSHLFRIGVVSAFYYDHPVWNAITKGLMSQLDPKLFCLSAFCTSHTSDSETLTARRFSRFFAGNRSIDEWVACITAEQPDLLIYPEVGMDTMTAKLASLRLAPVQMASWGHPETSGLATIDYYLSGELFEPEHGQKNYCEKLIILPNIGTYVTRMTTDSNQSIDLERFGLHVNRPIAVCAGNLFKYNPKHDHIFVKIAQEVKECKMVFFVPPNNDAIYRKFSARLQRAFAAEGLSHTDHVVFIPWLSPEHFHVLLRSATIMLDSIGFSGFNTVLQAAECGLPVVTLDGGFMRGRLGAGILRRLGLADTIAEDLDAYVQRAVRLCTDNTFRRSIQFRMAENLPSLFDDKSAVAYLQNILVDILRKR